MRKPIIKDSTADQYTDLLVEEAMKSVMKEYKLMQLEIKTNLLVEETDMRKIH